MSSCHNAKAEGLQQRQHSTVCMQVLMCAALAQRIGRRYVPRCMWGMPFHAFPRQRLVGGRAIALNHGGRAAMRTSCMAPLEPFERALAACALLALSLPFITQIHLPAPHLPKPKPRRSRATRRLRTPAARPTPAL